MSIDTGAGYTTPSSLSNVGQRGLTLLQYRLAASLTPYAAVESVAASVDSLTQALSRYNIIESNLAAADSSTEGYAPHSQQVGKLASRILSNPGSLLTSGILESFSKQDQVVYKGVLDEVFVRSYPHEYMMYAKSVLAVRFQQIDIRRRR